MCRRSKDPCLLSMLERIVGSPVDDTGFSTVGDRHRFHGKLAQALGDLLLGNAWHALLQKSETARLKKGSKRQAKQAQLECKKARSCELLLQEDQQDAASTCAAYLDPWGC